VGALPQPASFGRAQGALGWAFANCFRPLQALMTVPVMLFLIALTAMLFRPADHRFHSYDRFAFILLIFVVLVRSWVTQMPIRIAGPVVVPLSALLLLALYDALTQPYDAETWGVLAAKWLVPLGLYILAGYVFEDDESRRNLEIFSLATLAYLCAIAILFLDGAKDFIFPRYILDEGLGIHADRARGPFLQAVANGLSLNMLGLLALDSFRRHQLPRPLAIVLLVALPLAIVATKTRAVWLSFAASILWLMFFSPSRCLRRTSLCLVLGGGLVFAGLLTLDSSHISLRDRLAESGPVTFRMAVYEAGWKMFQEKPLLGWGSREMQTELSNQITEFHQEQFFFHNTLLEILVEYGLLGLALYLWLILDLFRLGRERHRLRDTGTFVDEHFRALWPLIVAVYLLNGCFVVMNYQFVNGILFTLAGILAAHNRRAQMEFDGITN